MDSTSLSGTLAFVTGGGKRIGRSIALALARAGADVVVHYHRSPSAAHRTADDVRALGRSAWTVPGDLGDPQQVESLLPAARDVAGGRPIGLLVNNASIFPEGGLLTFTPEDLAQNVQVNALAPLVLARAMAGQGGEGHVVNLLDSRVVDYDRTHVPYHLSKRMLLSLTRMLAVELAPLVRVNAVAPGLILPPPGVEDEEYLRRLEHTNPLHAHGSPEDIARAAVFLAESPFITGQVIFVDGGRHLKGNFYGV